MKNKMTEIERKAFEAVLNCEIQDGRTGAETIDHEVWTISCVNPFEQDRKIFSGAISSLCKKGYLKSNDYEGKEKAKDQTLAVSMAGYEAYLADSEILKSKSLDTPKELKDCKTYEEARVEIAKIGENERRQLLESLRIVDSWLGLTLRDKAILSLILESLS